MLQRVFVGGKGFEIIIENHNRVKLSHETIKRPLVQSATVLRHFYLIDTFSTAQLQLSSGQSVKATRSFASLRETLWSTRNRQASGRSWMIRKLAAGEVKSFLIRPSLPRSQISVLSTVIGLGKETTKNSTI